MKHKWLTEIAFAHRGLHGSLTGHVENSLSAFKAANQQGYGFELDILLSSDHRAMVFHDVDLMRLTGQTGVIDEYTAQQLSTIKLIKSSDTIPTLKSILTQTDPQLPILIEIKGDQNKPELIAAAVFDEIKDYPGPVAIMSFYPDIVSWYQKHAPDILRGLVATSLNDGDLPDDFFTPAYQISLIDDLAIDFIAYDITQLPNEVTEYCKKNGFVVLTWTVRTPEQRANAKQNTDNIIFEITA